VKATRAVVAVESALYSMLTYFAASKTVDFLIHGIEEYTAVVIVSERSDVIREAIVRDLKRGVTIYNGHGGLSGAGQHILLCVVTRLEIGGVVGVARSIDEGAFVVVHPVSAVSGGTLKRRAPH
jgi:uncharacterized membrane-anchored protein YitT (DUF2179 family)